MKIWRVLTLGIAFINPIFLHAESLFEGAIESVTIYTSGFAQVTRVQEVQIGPGETVLRSKPLPQAVDLSSVLAAVQGAGVIVQAVETRQELVTDKELESKLATFRDEYRKQDDTVFRVRQERTAIDEQIQTRREILAMLDKVHEKTAQTAEKEMDAQKMDAEAWRKVIDLVQARADKAKADIREFEYKKRDIDRRLVDEQKKLAEIARKAPKGCVVPGPGDFPTTYGGDPAGCHYFPDAQAQQMQRSYHPVPAYDFGSAQIYQTRVFITVSAKTRMKTKLSLSYNVSGADWTPTYRVYADLKAKTADLKVFAEVRQSSGEDWDNIQLSLSTARPDIGADMPALMPWYIRTGRIQPMRPGAAPSLARTEADAEETMPAAPPPAAASEAPAEDAPAAGVATVFTAQSRTTIPSDNESHRISVSSLSSPVELEHVAIPKILPHAFIQARLANRASFALIPGVIDVFVGGSYVGRGMMKTIAPGEAIKLSLGVDEQVKIQLKLAEDKGERKVRGGRAQSTNVFEILATNFKEEDVKLTVIDQLPISADGRVSVTYGSDAKRALRGAEFPGQLKWEFSLAPKKSQGIRFDFTIEYPEELRHQLEADDVEYNFERLEAETQAVSPGKSSAQQTWKKMEKKGKVKQDVAF
jgi:hypothetical protein